MANVKNLIRVLHRLMDAGNTVILIEHNLDIIAEADLVLDMRPEGGDKDGCIDKNGTTEQLTAKPEKSHTAQILGEFLGERSG